MTDVSPDVSLIALSFLQHEWDAIMSVSLYRRLYGDERLAPQTVQEFRVLPMVTRGLLTETPCSQRTLSVPGFKILVSSSGTTGRPIVSPWTVLDEDVAVKAAKSVHENVPWHSTDVVLVIAPMGMGSMWRHMQRQAEIAGATLLMPGLVTPDRAASLIDEHSVTVLMTLPSMALRVGEAMRSACRGRCTVRQVACGGDVLSQSRRERIEILWGVECFNFYGMSELFGPMAGECNERNGLHLDDHFLMELLPESGGVSDEIGEGVVSALWHRAAPTIRYRTEDLISLHRDRCACGRKSTVFHVHGKMGDCPYYNKKRLLLDHMDDLVLGTHGTGAEWELVLSSPTVVHLSVEQADSSLDVTDLQQTIGEYVGADVSVNALAQLEHLRKQGKPQRIRPGQPD